MKTRTFSILDERGSAVLEFLFFGIFLQMLVLALFLQVSSLQANQLVAESIARYGMRSFVLSGIDPKVTAAQVFNDFDIGGIPNVDLACIPDCLSAGSRLKLRVSLNSATATSVYLR